MQFVIASSANAIFSSANPIVSSANAIVSSTNPIVNSTNAIVSCANAIVSSANAYTLATLLLFKEEYPKGEVVLSIFKEISLNLVTDKRNYRFNHPYPSLKRRGALVCSKNLAFSGNY